MIRRPIPLSDNFEKSYRVAIVGSVIDDVGNVLLQNVTRALEPLCKELRSVTVDQRRPGLQNGKESTGFMGRLVRIFFCQVEISRELLRVSQDFDIVFVHAGSYWLALPILLSKLLGKRVILPHLGGDKLLEEQLNAGSSSINRFIITPIVLGLLKFTYSLADMIVCQSYRVCELRFLRGYRKKIFVVQGGGYVDTDRFRIETPIETRSNTIGYIGAFRPVKGVINLMQSVDLVLDRIPDAQFFIAGDGFLRSRLESEIRALPLGCSERVKLAGWVEHDNLPAFLNTSKLLVLPSFSEGVPLIVQEAMACGTIVLATPVGGVPDLIRDGRSGFITKDNDPRHLASNIVRALTHPNLAEVSRAAREIIEREYTLSSVTQGYSLMLAAVK
jgi:glycosyltransferase involved in cell wall biosynthesis